MPIPAFNLLSHDLVKAGVKAQRKHTGSSWMKLVSNTYSNLTPAEKLTLQRRAQKVAIARRGRIVTTDDTLVLATTAAGHTKATLQLPPHNLLPLRVECFAEAMGLDIIKVRQMYNQIAPNFPMSARMYNIAQRLKVTPPSRKVLKQRFKGILLARRGAVSSSSASSSSNNKKKKARVATTTTNTNALKNNTKKAPSKAQQRAALAKIAKKNAEKLKKRMAISKRNAESAKILQKALATLAGEAKRAGVKVAAKKGTTTALKKAPLASALTSQKKVVKKKGALINKKAIVKRK